MKYYSAYCNQNNEYFHTGRNSLSALESAEDISIFLMENAEFTDKEFNRLIKIPFEVCEMFEVEIKQHNKFIESGIYD